MTQPHHKPLVVAKPTRGKRHRNGNHKEDKQALANLVKVAYAHGMGPTSLANLTGWTPKTFWAYARSQGLPARPSGIYADLPSPLPHEVIVALIQAGFTEAGGRGRRVG